MYLYIEPYILEPMPRKQSFYIGSDISKTGNNKVSASFPTKVYINHIYLESVYDKQSIDTEHDIVNRI